LRKIGDSSTTEPVNQPIIIDENIEYEQVEISLPEQQDAEKEDLLQPSPQPAPVQGTFTLDYEPGVEEYTCHIIVVECT